MRLLKLRHHVVTWILLILLVAQTVYIAPARQRYFEHLSGFNHGHPLAWAYVSIFPVFFSLLYAFTCTEPWRYVETGKWIPIRLVPKGLLLLIGLCSAMIMLDRAGFDALSTNARPPESFFADLLNTIWILLVAGFLAVLIDGLSNSKEAHARRAKISHDALVEAKTRLVVAQLDPHNTLNILSNVGGLIRKDPVRAEQMLGSAGYYLRRLLDSTKARHIALWQEREIIEDYLAVEAIRLGDRLRVDWAWDEGLDDIQLPPILIQPMVENAIKHGIAPCPGGGALRIEITRIATGLRLQVSNTGEPLSRQHRPGSTGIENLRQRLAHEYGPLGTFALASDGIWTVATVFIPLEPVCFA